MTFIAEFLPLFVRGQAFQLVLAQFFEKRRTEPICTFSLCGKHCFPYLQDHSPWAGDLRCVELSFNELRYNAIH
jgi:hypothetical protein